jgi:CheY-like chemotaxis protein
MLRLCFVDDLGLAERLPPLIESTSMGRQPAELQGTVGLCFPFPPVVESAGPSVNYIFDKWMTGALDYPLERNDTILFLIHANAQLTPGSWLQECEGVEFLKHLRLTSPQDSDSPERSARWERIRCAHAIVYSFESLEHILRRRAGDLILTSKGVTFLRLPEMLHDSAPEELSEVDRLTWKAPLSLQTLNAKAAIKADVTSESFRAAIRADYPPPDSAHAFANWWGIRRLIEGAKEIHAVPPAGIKMPSTVEERSKHLSSKKAIFLSCHEWKETKRKTTEGEKRLISGLREKIRRYIAVPSTKPLIVYVDDQMDEGWYEAVYFALSGQQGKSIEPFSWLKPIDPMKITAPEQFSSGRPESLRSRWRRQLHAIVRNILESSPRLVITDLRLRGESEKRDSFASASGARLIRLLRKLRPALPILLITASNRADSVQQAERAGADAYWTKEGIGERSSSDGEEFHASEFALLVERLLDDDYRLLQALDRTVKHAERLKDGSKPVPCQRGIWQRSDTVTRPWWLSHRWTLRVTAPHDLKMALENTRVNLHPAVDHLNAIVRMYREYLRRKKGFASPDGMTAQMWRRSICLQVGIFIEFIHCFPALEGFAPAQGRSYASAHAISACRGDWLGGALHDIRNEASHFNDKKLKDRSLFLILLSFLYWLRVCGPRGHEPTKDSLQNFLRVGLQINFSILGNHSCTPLGLEDLLNL